MDTEAYTHKSRGIQYITNTYKLIRTCINTPITWKNGNEQNLKYELTKYLVGKLSFPYNFSLGYFLLSSLF